jgi:peroxiredoxin
VEVARSSGPQRTVRQSRLLRYPDVWSLNPAGYLHDMTEPSRRDGTSGDAVPGEPAPAFATAASTGKVLALDDFTGVVPIVLTFLGTLPPAEAEAVIATFNDVFAEFGRHQYQLLIVTPEGEEAIRARRRGGTAVPLLADDDGELLERFASSATFPATVVIDESGTVTRVLEGGTPNDHVAAVRAVTTDVADDEVDEKEVG